jgi:LPS export ABC transporter protein LptC
MGRKLLKRLLFCTTSLLLALAGCSPSEPGTASERPDSTGPLPEQTFYDYRAIETDGGVREYVLDSDRMQKFPNLEQLHLVRVKMDFYQEGDYFSTLTADSGRANPQTKDVFVWGNVVVVTIDRRRLTTEELYYDSGSGLIRNDVFNTLDRGFDVVTGIGLEATPDLKYIELKQQVEATVGDETTQELE